MATCISDDVWSGPRKTLLLKQPSHAENLGSGFRLLKGLGGAVSFTKPPKVPGPWFPTGPLDSLNGASVQSCFQVHCIVVYQV